MFFPGHSDLRWYRLGRDDNEFDLFKTTLFSLTQNDHGVIDQPWEHEHPLIPLHRQKDQQVDGHSDSGEKDGQNEDGRVNRWPERKWTKNLIQVFMLQIYKDS